jgi:mRNA interferase RelE/StbE
MIVKVSKIFDKELSKINDQKLKKSVFEIIKLVQQVNDIRGIPQLKKLKGHQNFYRIRLGQYRAGIAIINNTVEFLVIDHRKDVYKRFP